MAAQTRNTLFQLDIVEKPRIAVGISMLSIVPEISIFRFKRPYCYFRLSIVVAIIWGHFLWRRCCRKVRLWYLNCNNTYSGSVLSYYQHDHKISPVSKNSHVFDVMPNNSWCTDWRPDCCILYPLHIQEKSRKDSAQCWTEIFYWFKNWAGGFFTPSAIRGLNGSSHVR